QAEAMAKGPAEMRGIAKAVSVGNLRDGSMRLGGIRQVRPRPLQPALANIMGKVVADAFEQFLQISFGNSLSLGDARRREFGIVEAALDGLANPVQDSGLRRRRAGI